MIIHYHPLFTLRFAQFLYVRKHCKVKVTFPKIALEDSMKKRLEGAAKACPVKNSLNTSIEVITEFVY